MQCLVPKRWLWREQSNLQQCPYLGQSELNQVISWQSVRCESVNCGDSEGEEIWWHLPMPQHDGCAFSCVIPDRLSLSAGQVRGDDQVCYAAWLSQVISWLLLEVIYLLKANSTRVFSWIFVVVFGIKEAPFTMYHKDQCVTAQTDVLSWISCWSFHSFYLQIPKRLFFSWSLLPPEVAKGSNITTDCRQI